MIVQSIHNPLLQFGAWITRPGTVARGIQLVALTALAVLVLFDGIAQAGTTGAAFQPAFDFLNGGVTGYLGRALVMGALIIGGFYAAGKQQPGLAGGAFVIALFIGIGPAVLNTMVSATI